MNKSLATNSIALVVIIIGYISPIWGEQIRSIGFFALSGAITNWLAIHMLFEKVPFLYGSGVVPNHFEDFKSGIKHLIMDQFFTEENMRKFLSETLEAKPAEFDVEPALDCIEYDKAFESLTSLIMESSFGGMLGMFGGAAVLQGFREPFEVKIRSFIKEQATDEQFQQALISAYGNQDDLVLSVKDNVDLIVESRLNELTPQIVKQIVQDMIAKHLGWLVIWGGVFGGLIGLVMSFTNF